MEQLAQRAAIDVDTFYQHQPRPDAVADQALGVSVDGKGIVMRREGLQPSTAKVGKPGHKLQTRLSSGEKRGCKRMAEVGSVSGVIPVGRTPTDILQPKPSDPKTPKAPKTPGPKAQDKWLPPAWSTMPTPSLRRSWCWPYLVLASLPLTLGPSDTPLIRARRKVEISPRGWNSLIDVPRKSTAYANQRVLRIP